MSGLEPAGLLKLTFPPRHKINTKPVVPHWKVKSACARISSTRVGIVSPYVDIEIGSAVVSILASAAPSLKRSESPTYSAFTGLMKRKQENFTSVSQQAALSSWLALTALSRATL